MSTVNASPNLSFELERKGDLLTARSAQDQSWFGWLFIAMTAVFALAWISTKAGNSGFFGGLVTCAVLICAGAAFVFPRAITTAFDLRARTVAHTIAIGRIYQKRRTYGFDEIASLGIDESYNDGYQYMPVLRLRDGQTRWLAANKGGYLCFAEPMQALAAATGLVALDGSSRASSTSWPGPEESLRHGAAEVQKAPNTRFGPP